MPFIYYKIYVITKTLVKCRLLQYLLIINNTNTISNYVIIIMYIKEQTINKYYKTILQKAW